MSTEPRKNANREKIEADMAVTRKHLTESVEALAAKADLKGQAAATLDETKMKAERAADEAKIKAAEARDLAAAKASRAKSRIDDLSPLAIAALTVVPILLLVVYAARRARRG